MQGATGVFTAEVTDVDPSTRSCTVLNISGGTQTEYTGVLLMAVVDDGQFVVPTIGSTVIVGNNKDMQPFVIMFSQIDSIVWIAGSSKISVKNGLIQYNDGSFGGLIEVVPTLQALNAIQEDINKLKQAFAGWTPVANDGGAALKVQLGLSYPTAPITVTKQEDIENTAIKHGK